MISTSATEPPDEQRWRDQVLFVDGTYREVYCPDTNIQDWIQLVDALRRVPGVRIEFVGNDKEGQGVHELTPSMFGTAGNRRMDVWLGSMCACAYMHTPDEIELTVSPHAAGAEGPRVVPRLLRVVGKALRRRVHITAESSPDEILVTYDPVREVFEFPGER